MDNENWTSPSPTTKCRHAVLERRKALAGLLVGGVTHCRAVAEPLGMSKSTAANDLNWLFEEWRNEPVADLDRVSAVELQRLDLATEGLMNGIKQGKPGHVQAAVKVQERRAKLLGLAAPTKTVTASATVDYSAMSLEELRERVKRLMARVDELDADD